MNIPESAIGPILTTVVAALVSVLGLIITKEQKVSDLRQAWIDELRNDLALYVSYLNAMHSSLWAGGSYQHGSSPEEAWRVSKEDYSGANRTLARILLRLNPKEHVTLVELIKALDSEFYPGRLPNPESLDRLEHDTVSEAQAVLKMEWERVKRGEPIYRIAKYALAGLFIAGLALITYTYVA